MDKAGLHSWIEQNLQDGERIVWTGSPRLVFFRGVFLTRIVPGLILLGLAVWFHYGAPGIPLPEWAMFLTAAFPKEIVMLLGILLLVVPPLRGYMLRHTSYVLTNRRIIKARVLSNRVRQEKETLFWRKLLFVKIAEIHFLRITTAITPAKTTTPLRRSSHLPTP